MGLFGRENSSSHSFSQIMITGHTDFAIIIEWEAHKSRYICEENQWQSVGKEITSPAASSLPLSDPRFQAVKSKLQAEGLESEFRFLGWLESGFHPQGFVPKK
ncbi:hypothetical protein AO498_05177 [Algoriphagus sanaruensis]|uniref:Uncharacterized protein n=1 Tax=Algoriphagus sanaruensis TaxID=1727163 RepID=A0A142EKY7_9BACT|nr:hypothetical protein AO498_05177 [Algoriphagus sanaruensis]